MMGHFLVNLYEMKDTGKSLMHGDHEGLSVGLFLWEK